jgi:hypothetical protein
MPQLIFLTFFLGLTTGTGTVTLQADPAIASIRLEIDGRKVATIDHAPWSAEIDFGPELIPRNLVAIGYDPRGIEIARTSQVVNLPRAIAEVDILVKNQNGRPARVQLVGSHRKHSKPVESKLSIDGTPVLVDGDFKASLPILEWSQPHVLSAEMHFTDGEVARREVVLEGGIGQRVSSDLTPVLVDAGRNGEPKSLDACFTLEGSPVRVNAIEKTNPLVIVVKDPDMSGYRNRWMAQRESDMPLDRDTSQRILWATAQRFSAADEPTYLLFSPTIDVPASHYGIPWLLTRSLEPRPPRATPRLFADAVGVAGLVAYESGRRRAVVLLLSNTESSRLTPAVVRRYLERLGVPLFVWSMERASTNTAWGPVVDISTRWNLERAVSAVANTLKTQRIAWVATDPLTSLRIEGNDRCGLKPVARIPATEPAASPRPAS